MNKVFKWLYQQRAKMLYKEVYKHLSRGEKVLDIGAGNGYLGELLNRNFKITLLDIVDYNQSKLPLKLFDGEKIPFGNDHFNTSLILSVLHHAPYPKRLIKEAKRVSSRILVVEDTYTTYLGKLFLNFWDLIWDSTIGIGTSYNFNTSEGWERVFKELGLKVTHKSKILNSLRLHTLSLFILEK